MGAKQSSSKSGSKASLNPSERRRLTVFLQSTGSQSQFSRHDMNNLWKDLLVPDLLRQYTDFLMKQDVQNKNCIGIDEFTVVYSSLVRGDSEEKAGVLAEIIGHQKKNDGDFISYQGLCKYFSDVLESYFLSLKSQNDVNYKSWTYSKQPERCLMEEVVKGFTNDLIRKEDDVQVQDLERWIEYTGVVSVLHSYVLGFIYHLEPDVKGSIIPLADFETSKIPTMLDLSYVVYLNSHLTPDYKVNWRFLFSTNTHGESFSKLVGCITNQGPIIVVVQADDKSIFGGFISQNLSTGPKWLGTNDCFLFTLVPEVQMFSSTGYNDHYGYLNISQSSLPNGLGMGGQFNYWGLWIDSQFGNGECSESCTTYKNYKMLASKKRFRIHRIEVWGVGNPPPTAEELGERSDNASSQISALDKDAQASRLLDMAGHKSYSKGIREKRDSLT